MGVNRGLRSWRRARIIRANLDGEMKLREIAPCRSSSAILHRDLKRGYELRLETRCHPVLMFPSRDNPLLLLQYTTNHR
jgi:hypothetical protein